MSHRLIKIPADPRERMSEITVENFDFPDLNVGLFGPDVNIEYVAPKGFADLNIDKRRVVMVVDEEGLMHQRPLNKRASYLYGTHVHGQPIVGDAFVLVEMYIDTADGPDLEQQGLPEDIGILQVNDAINTSIKHGDEIFR